MNQRQDFVLYGRCVLGNKHPFVKLQSGCLVSLLSIVLVQGSFLKPILYRASVLK